MKITTLHANDWLSLKKIVAPEHDVGGYVYSHETRTNGHIIAVLPFRKRDEASMDIRSQYEFLIRHEVTPCWGMSPSKSSVTGGIEKGDTPAVTALKELKEETGYEAGPNELILLGQSRASKSADTIYSLYAVDVTGKKAGEATGDGTGLDTNATVSWTVTPYEHEDPQLAVMWARLMDKLVELQP